MGMWKKLAPSLVIAVLVLAGCGSGAPKATPADQAAEAKPPLVIPATFESEQAKLEFAIEAVKNGYYSEAKPLLEQTLAVNEDVEGLRQLGVVNYNLGNFGASTEIWDRVANLSPELAGEAYNNKGNALRDSNRVEEAIEAYERALELDPSRWTAATNLALLFKEHNRLDDAIAVLEGYLQADGENIQVASLLSSLKAEVENPQA